MKKIINKRTVVVLHAYGAEHHYRALKHLLKDNQMKLAFYEFNIFRMLVKSVLTLNKALFLKQLVNIKKLLILAISRDSKVVLGIAPHDSRLIYILYILRSHQIYYHTSQPYWNKVASYPWNPLFFSKQIKKLWGNFLVNKIEHIFCATTTSKMNLMKHKNVPDKKITVVYHAYDSKIYFPNTLFHDMKTKKFIFVGRLVPTKGLERLLKYFSQTQNVTLTVVGNGELMPIVEKYANEYENIDYLGYISDQKKLAEIYREHHYLVMLSIKKPTWEELFGMVIIEAMACGVVPICTDHAGPKEIIEHSVNGYLSQESNYEDMLNILLSNSYDKKYDIVRKNAIERARDFDLDHISHHWKEVLNS